MVNKCKDLNSFYVHKGNIGLDKILEVFDHISKNVSGKDDNLDYSLKHVKSILTDIEKDLEKCKETNGCYYILSGEMNRTKRVYKLIYERFYVKDKQLSHYYINLSIVIGDYGFIISHGVKSQIGKGKIHIYCYKKKKEGLKIEIKPEFYYIGSSNVGGNLIKIDL